MKEKEKPNTEKIIIDILKDIKWSLKYTFLITGTMFLLTSAILSLIDYVTYRFF